MTIRFDEVHAQLISRDHAKGQKMLKFSRTRKPNPNHVQLHSISKD